MPTHIPGPPAPSSLASSVGETPGGDHQGALVQEDGHAQADRDLGSRLALVLASSIVRGEGDKSAYAGSPAGRTETPRRMTPPASTGPSDRKNRCTRNALPVGGKKWSSLMHNDHRSGQASPRG